MLKETVIGNRCPVEAYEKERFLLFSHEPQHVCETTGIFCLSRSYAWTNTADTRRHTLTAKQVHTHTSVRYYTSEHTNIKCAPHSTAAAATAAMSVFTIAPNDHTTHLHAKDTAAASDKRFNKLFSNVFVGMRVRQM